MWSVAGMTRDRDGQQEKGPRLTLRLAFGRHDCSGVVTADMYEREGAVDLTQHRFGDA